MRFRLCMAALLLLALSAFPVAPAYAATINVTTTADDLTDNGNCSLREAIRAANTNAAVDACTAGSGADTIVLPAGTYTLSLEGEGEYEAATGDLDILESLTITGALSSTTVIDAGALDFGLSVRSGHTTFNDLTVQNAKYTGIYALKSTELTLNRVTVRDNQMGGVLSEGKATISDSLISENPSGLEQTVINGSSTVTFASGGVTNHGHMTVTHSAIVRNGRNGDVGGGIGNTGMLTITDSLIAYNQAMIGGGVYNVGDSPTAPPLGALAVIERTVIAHNTSHLMGGGLYNKQRMIVRDSEIAHNEDKNVSQEGGGGGIFNEWALSISDSVMHNNAAVTLGGALFSVSSVELQRTQVLSNSAQLGGGIYLEGPWYPNDEVLISDTLIQNNQADLGGGLFGQGTFTLANSAVISNTAKEDGGGLHIWPWSFHNMAFTDLATVMNTTISGNHANGFGGGVYVLTSTLKLNNTTLVNNVANADQDAVGDGGGLFYSGVKSTSFKNSIIVGNLRGNQANDCMGSAQSQGYNLLGVVSACTTVSSDSVGQPALLGPLAANGGPTPTHALLPNSPAIDAGDPLGCRDSFEVVLLTDQRGVPRHTGPACDIGAFEVAPESLTVILHMQQPVNWPGHTASTKVLVWSPQGVPTGTVVLKNGSTVLGSASLVDGVCTFTLPTLELGEYALVAEYQGGGAFEAANSAVLTYSVRMPVFLPVTERE